MAKEQSLAMLRLEEEQRSKLEELTGELVRGFVVLPLTLAGPLRGAD